MSDKTPKQRTEGTPEPVVEDQNPVDQSINSEAWKLISRIQADGLLITTEAFGVHEPRIGAIVRDIVVMGDKLAISTVFVPGAMVLPAKDGKGEERGYWSLNTGTIR